MNINGIKEYAIDYILDELFAILTRIETCFIITPHLYDTKLKLGGLLVSEMCPASWWWFLDNPEAYPKIQTAVVTDTAEANRLHRELMEYVLDKAWAIPRVATPYYSMWWPWPKNYSGEVSVGYNAHFYNWVWLDQELKKSMGY